MNLTERTSIIRFVDEVVVAVKVAVAAISPLVGTLFTSV